MWVRADEAPDIHKRFGTGKVLQYQVGNFTYRLLFRAGHKFMGMRFKLAILLFYLREGLRLSRKQKFDCIMVYGWMSTGIAGWILACLTRSKLIVTIQGVPQNAHRFNSYRNPYGPPKQDFMTWVARTISDRLLHFVLRRADCVRILYPEQLDAFPKLAKVPRYVLYDFIPYADIPAVGTNDGSVLLIGAPWYVKGVDILIRAFRMVEGEFPQARLKLLGHFPGEDFKDLIGESRQIEVLKARNHRETMALLVNCSIFALASRTDAQPRVLFEAMAAGKPLIAPKVGGIPYYVQEGVNGLLFERENVADLARQLQRLLSSPELQARLGRQGRELARTRYNETAMGVNILDMVTRTFEGSLEKERAATAASAHHASSQIARP